MSLELSPKALDLAVLRSLLSLARRATPPTLEQLADGVAVEPSAVRRSLIALARAGLVQRTPQGLRLSLSGLAVAVATAKAPRPVAPATVVPAITLQRRTSRAA